MCLLLKLLFSWALWQKCYPALKMRPIEALQRLSFGSTIEGPVANIARRSGSVTSGRRRSLDGLHLRDAKGAISSTADNVRVGPSPPESQVRSPASITPSVATSSKSSKRAVTPEAWNPSAFDANDAESSA